MNNDELRDKINEIIREELLKMFDGKEVNSFEAANRIIS